MPDFAVLRFAKLSSLQALAGASAHNTRTATSGLAHADNRAPKMGGGFCLLRGQENAVEAWHSRTKAVGLGKVRKDAVRALEAILSASPEWFAQASATERALWVERSMEWASRTFQSENILQATLHDDEETPHIHILAVPLVQKERKKSGRPRKNRKRSSSSSIPSWGLSASDLIGSREQLTALQTAYAEEVADLGLRRGRPRRTTGAHHRSANAYRVEAAEDRFSATIALADAQSNARGEIFFAELEAEEITKEARQNADQLAAAFTLGLDAIEAGELIYRPGDDNCPPGLHRRKIEAPCLPLDRPSFRQWCEAVRPVFSRLVGYARRLSLISSREHHIIQQSNDLAVEGEAVRRVAERQAATEKDTGRAKQDAAILARSRALRAARGVVRG